MRLEDRLEMMMEFNGISSIDTSSQRWFVINYGPPASGKGGVKTNSYILKLLSNSFSDIDVDTIVADMFHGDVSKLTQEKYWKLRTKADEESDNQLIRSVINRSNIIWETTGKNKAWIKYVIEFMKQNGYLILLVIPMLYLSEEVSRCRQRKQAANCSLEYLGDIRLQSYNNFEDISKESNRTLIFDNNKKMFLLYDSEKRSCGDLHYTVFDPDQTGLHDFVVRECRRRSRRSIR